MPFKFIVKSFTEEKEPALVFESTPRLAKIGRNGGQIGKFPVKGWIEVARDYLEQDKTGQFYITPKQIDELNTRGTIMLDDQYADEIELAHDDVDDFENLEIPFDL
jgi:hypothetical protein